MQIEFNRKDDVGIATLEGSLNAVTVDKIRSEFKSWYDGQTDLRNVVMDFSAVEMVDSAGLGVLIALLKYVSQREGDLKLAGLSSRVRLVFEITRTHRIFDILDTVDEALGAME